ncbi:hypothetical protein KL930_003422 [Ogataea haglerorum]|nr:hypothetical protein KL950_002820 [Ogataea haglerorum]KAG7737312.1 hypothetical protein KL923_003701 [Ogataea haglerorum]KAG7743178.1 hypothetical protein KL932_001919 [Ogataea haglerorum]KAG7775222.1 hypothetical protein KL930_003422 [Ogataea haglerorum]KAG7778007.1 hypothetical protein KL922_002193 [Ogataea haglerorum]
MGQQISRNNSAPGGDSDAHTTRSSASQKSGFLHSTAVSSPRKWRKLAGLLRRRRSPETLSEPSRMVSRSLLSPAQSSVDALRSVSSNLNASSGSVAESPEEPEQSELLTSQFRSLSSLLETVTMSTLRRLINVNVDYVGERIYPEDNLDGSMDTDFASFVHSLTSEDLLQHALGYQMDLGRNLSFFRAFRFDNSSHLGYNSSLHEFERLVPVLIVGVVGLNVPQAQSEQYRSWLRGQHQQHDPGAARGQLRHADQHVQRLAVSDFPRKQALAIGSGRPHRVGLRHTRYARQVSDMSGRLRKRRAGPPFTVHTRIPQNMCRPVASDRQ